MICRYVGAGRDPEGGEGREAGWRVDDLVHELVRHAGDDALGLVERLLKVAQWDAGFCVDTQGKTCEAAQHVRLDEWSIYLTEAKAGKKTESSLSSRAGHRLTAAGPPGMRRSRRRP
jgi:hypothetical protein